MHSIKCFFTNTTHVIIGNIGQPFTVTCLKCLRVVAAAEVKKWWPVPWLGFSTGGR